MGQAHRRRLAAAADGELGAQHVPPVFAGDETQPQPVLSRAHSIQQQLCRPLDVAHQQVAVAVVVHVAHCQAAAVLRGDERGSRGGRRVLEQAGAPVAEELLGLRIGKGHSGRRLARVAEDQAVDRGQVQAAVVVVVEERRPPAREGLARPGHAAGGAPVLEQPVAGVHVERGRLRVQVRHEEVRVAVVVRVPRGHAHAAQGVAGGVEGGARHQAVVPERAVALVHPQQLAHLVVGHVDVRPAIAIEVGRHHAQPAAGLGQDAALAAHVLEGAVAAVPEQPVRLRGVVLRAAVVGDAGGAEAGLPGPGPIVDVGRDEEVEPAVAVVVHEEGARGPARVAAARGGGDVFERAVRAVAPELVGPVVGQVEVRPPVVVVVPHGHALAVARGPDAAGLGHIGEAQAGSPVGAGREVVAEEPAPRGPVPGRGGRAVDGARRLHQVDVLVTVVVVIQEGHPGARDLREQMVPLAPVAVHEAQAGGLRHVLEDGRGGRLRGSRATAESHEREDRRRV